MRSATFLFAGLAFLIVQANVFRVVDGIGPGVAAALVALALAADLRRLARELRGGWQGGPRATGTFRGDWSLAAFVLFGYSLLVSVGHVHVGSPIPALVFPLILFMGVHEYSLARGAMIAAALGYATDVLGIAPVGLYTFTYVATFVLARGAGVRLAAQTTWMQVLLVGAFSLLESTMVLVLLAIFGRDPWVPRTLYPLAFPHAIATAAVAPAVFRIAQALHAATSGAPRAPVGAGTPP
jgi:rod shape-determining protein MreD